MKYSKLLQSALQFMLISGFLCSTLFTVQAQQWPGFRGEFASGIQDGADLPDTWNVETSENVKWKIDIPGLGLSSPVIWDNKLYLTTAISGGGEDGLKVGLYGDIDAVEDESQHEYWVYCVDKNTGDVLWKKLAYKGVPATKRHTKSSHANPTIATNGKYVVAFFGSEGLYCYDNEGMLLWQRNFGTLNSAFFRVPEASWGFASSPLIYEDKVIIQCDVIGDCFVAALDVKTGEDIWRSKREDVPTWSTPNVYEGDNTKQVIVNGFKHIGGYDLATGEEIWRMANGGDIPVPTPIFANDLIYIHGAHGRYAPIYAIKPTAEGDITLKEGETTNEFVAWGIERGGAYMSTALVYGDYLYNMRGNGMLSCYNALTGELVFKERIPDARSITASGVAADGKLYYCTEQGLVFVVRASDKFEVLAKNDLNDIIMATPAISDKHLYIRTQHHLLAVGY
jgi:outer membrane protein assembly factor BamB